MTDPFMQKYKITPQIKMRMLWIAFGGAIIAALIFAFGFFAMSKQVWKNAQQCRDSLNQISQTITALRHSK